MKAFKLLHGKVSCRVRALAGAVSGSGRSRKHEGAGAIEAADAERRAGKPRQSEPDPVRDGAVQVQPKAALSDQELDRSLKPHKLQLLRASKI